MKKQFLVFSMATLLVLGACGGGGKGNSNSSTSEEDSGYHEPEVELGDAFAETMNIDFDEIEETCMLNPKAKTYIDAMEEQEKTLDRPYHFSSLYGPDDYAKLAAASDKGDGVTYADADTGGVDVCQILSRNDDGNDCKNYPIKLTWDDDGGYDGAVVKFWSTEDQSDMREVATTVKEGKVIAELPNLYRARKYRVQVVCGDDASQGYEFTTGDYPRAITMGGIHNVRDIGGYVTSYGVRTNQGLLYRGYYIDDKSGGHGANYSEAAGQVNAEVMKIGLELDLQKESETNGRKVSCLEGAEYKCRTLVSYDNFLKEDSYKNLPEVFHDFANADEKHVYFHCWGGADRTGMLAFFINAILGVSYTDLIEDFELTTQTNNKRCHMHNSSSAHYAKFMNEFLNNWAGFNPDATVNENCEKWLLEVPGVDPADIERIREIMLPGYADGELQADKLIPTYTPSGDWVTNGLAHWKVAEEDPNVKCNWGRHDGTVCTICGNGQGGGQDTSSSQPVEDNYLEVLSRVWTVTKTENNSDGKPYEQLKDNSKNKVGVRIKFTDYGAGSTATVSDGKLGPTNDTTVYLEYKIKAPKAGAYQMILDGRVSDDSKTLNERSFSVKLNGQNVDTQGDRTAGLVGTGDNEFVGCPTIMLTGNEDVIRIACPNYRIIFNLSGMITFAEH